MQQRHPIQHQSPRTVLIIYCTNTKQNNLECVKEQICMFHKQTHQIYVVIPVSSKVATSVKYEDEPHPHQILKYHPSSIKTVEGFLTAILRIETDPETNLVLIHWDRNYSFRLIKQLRTAQADYPGCAIGFGGYTYDEYNDYFVYTTNCDHPCWLDSKKGIILQRNMFEADYEGIITAKRYIDAPYFEGRHEWAWSSYLHHKNVDMRVVRTANRKINRPTRKDTADVDSLLCQNIDYSSTLKDSRSGLIVQTKDNSCCSLTLVVLYISAVIFGVVCLVKVN